MWLAKNASCSASGTVPNSPSMRPAIIGAQPRQRLLMEKPGEIVGRVRNEFAVRQTDEQGGVFFGGFIRTNRPGKFGEIGIASSQHAVVAAEIGKSREGRSVGRRSQQPPQQTPSLRP